MLVGGCNARALAMGRSASNLEKAADESRCLFSRVDEGRKHVVVDWSVDDAFRSSVERVLALKRHNLQARHPCFINL